MPTRRPEWDDAHVWVPTPEPEPRTLEQQVETTRPSCGAQGSPLGDLLAERAESLADQIRFLGATT